MAGKRGSGLAGHITRAEPVRESAYHRCAANGCPLTGSITTESGAHVCSIHLLAKAEGWPKATGVIVHHIALYDMARKAQSVGTPLSANSESASLLFKAAKADGMYFNDSQREVYRVAQMKLTAAGQIVEAAIAAKAVMHSMEEVKDKDDIDGRQKVDKEADEFNDRLRGLLNNMHISSSM